MKHWIKIVCVSFLITLSGNGMAQHSQDSLHAPAKILTLQEVLAALESNPALLQFDDRVQSYDAYAKGARSLDPPKITGGWWMTPYNMDPNAGGAIMIGAEQMIMNPGKRKAEQKYMGGMSSVEQTMKAYDRQNMIAEAKDMYYDWLIAKKKLTMLEGSEQLLQLMIKSAEIGYTYNQNPLGRIYKAKSELYSLQNMQLMLQNDIRQMNVSLNTLMNVDKEIVFEIDTNYVISDYEVQVVDKADLFDHRSDIRNLQATVRLNGMKKELELSKRKPDFGIQYAHMNSLGNMPNQFTLMGMVTIPIAPWSSGRYRANVQGLKYEAAALQRRKEAIVNETTGKLEKLRASITARKKQLYMYEHNIIPSLEKNFHTSLIAFEHMKEDLFMTIDAWLSLKMVRIEHLDLLSQVLKMQSAYERQIEKE